MLRLFLIIGILTFKRSLCQNFVSNYSFEYTNNCSFPIVPILGQDAFQITGCYGWSVPTYASSDLHCNYSSFSFQTPKTGDNMAGIILYENTVFEYREYIQNELTSPLEKNKNYYVSFFISPAYSDNSTSSIGAYLSNDKITAPLSYTNFNYSPQIYNPKSHFLTDTLNWIKISGIFKAKGGERYITIGNFDSVNNCEILDFNNIVISEFYLYIDDVVVSCVEDIIPNIITPNGDGMNDFFKVDFPYNFLKIYNRWGDNIFETNTLNEFWSGTNRNQPANEGTYYYIINTDLGDYKGFIHLLR